MGLGSPGFFYNFPTFTRAGGTYMSPGIPHDYTEKPEFPSFLYVS